METEREEIVERETEGIYFFHSLSEIPGMCHGVLGMSVIHTKQQGKNGKGKESEVARKAPPCSCTHASGISFPPLLALIMYHTLLAHSLIHTHTNTHTSPQYLPNSAYE